jgi:hypothetical protein
MHFRATIALLALLLMVGSGCLFDARDATPPDTGGENTVIFDDPEDVFTGLTVGLEEDAFSNYERAVGDDYIFSPLLDDSLDQNFDATTFTSFTRNVELDVMRLVLSESDSIQVEFSPKPTIDQNSFVRYETTYSLRLVPTSGGDASIYRGTANIDVRRISGVWQIVYWDEIEGDAQYSSWGFLRGITRQRLGGP